MRQGLCSRPRFALLPALWLLLVTYTTSGSKFAVSKLTRIMSHQQSLPVAGVWQREWEEDPLGDSQGADRDTLVLWTQSRDSGIYVDIRLPLGSPGRSLEAARGAGIQPRSSALAASSQEQTEQLEAKGLLDIILQQKSFAGVLQYSAGDTTSGQALTEDKILADLDRQTNQEDGDNADSAAAAVGRIGLCTCFWRRDLDYQPPSGGLDVGVCASEMPAADGSVFLRETGDDASYAEGWRRLPGTNEGPFMALELVSENGHDRSGYWVRAGNRFGYAVGRPKDAVAAVALQCSLQAAAIRDCVGKTLLDSHQEQDLNAVASYVCVTGEIDAAGQWRILHSTNPELVGCLLVNGDSSSNNKPDGDDNDAPCCSRLVSKDTALSVGQNVDQILQDVNGADVTRQWRIAELTNCGLATCQS